MSSAFSIAGTILDLGLSPLLEANGWRAVVWASVGIAVLLLPAMRCILKPGPLAVGGDSATHLAASDGDTPAKSSEKDVSRCEMSQADLSKGEMKGGYMSHGMRHGASPGVPAAEALRGGTFWAMWWAIYLHLTYGAILSGHLPTLLRMMANLSVTTSAQLSALQFIFAIIGKILSGVLLSMQRVPRLLLFVVTPMVYCGSHLLLIDVSALGLLRGNGIVTAITVTQSVPRIALFAVVAGLTFGLIFSTLLCLPMRLFGRRDLPRLQSYAYSAILASAASFGPLVGMLRDLVNGYQLPIAITFLATALQCTFMALVLKRADASATDTMSPPRGCVPRSADDEDGVDVERERAKGVGP